MIWFALAIAVVAFAFGVAAGHALGRRKAAPAPAPAKSDTSQRLESLGVLAAGVVHEIAQPLSAARVSVEGLHYLRQLGRAPSEQQLAKVLDRVGMSLLAMVQILDHLRYLAGVGAARTALPTVLEDAVGAVIADRSNWLRWSDVRIELQAEGRTRVRADPVGLRLIVSNLVRNAAEAVAGLAPERQWIRIVFAADGAVSVCDPGPGIPPELVDELFRPYVSTRGEARGFGLSLAHAAAQRMGGHLSYRRDAQAGLSVFTLRLQPAEATRAEFTPRRVQRLPS